MTRSELSYREAPRLGEQTVHSGHLTLGAMRAAGLAAEILGNLGVSYDDLRGHITTAS